MCEQDYENKKLVSTKFSFFLQTRNSNFRLSANRPLYYVYFDAKKLLISFIFMCYVYHQQYMEALKIK